MTTTARRGWTLIAPTQSNKATTANDRFQSIEDAFDDLLSVDLTAGSVTLTGAQWSASGGFYLTGTSTAGRTVTVPAQEGPRDLMLNPAWTHSVSIVRGSTSITLAPGAGIRVYADGTTNGLRAVARSDAAVGSLASLPQGGATTGQSLVWSGSAWAPATVNGGIRNLIINGNPTINQRGYVSGTATSGANQYTLDRWRVVTSGQSVSWSDSAGIRTVTAPAGGMEQVVEGVNILAGTYTLSWTGTATATVNGSAVSSGGQVTLPGNTDATVRMTGGTWSQLQLEPGNSATTFERRPYGTELSLCQRYYCKGTTGGPTNNEALFSAGAAATGPYTSFPETMRTAPTMAFTDLSGNASRFSDISGAVSNQVVSSGSPVSVITADGFFPDFSASASGLNRWRINWTATAEL